MTRTFPQNALIGVPTDIGAGHRGASMGPEARHRSVLWWVTQPLAPYITRAVWAPLTARSRTISTRGSTHSERAVGSAGQ